MRAAARKAAEDAHDVPAFLRRKLAPALRDAVAKARDEIERPRRPSDRVLAAGIVASLPGARVPAVHELGTADVEAFLRSLRTKDGTGSASRKTGKGFAGD